MKMKKYAIGNGVVTDGQDLFIEPSAILIELDENEAQNSLISSEARKPASEPVILSEARRIAVIIIRLF